MSPPAVNWLLAWGPRCSHDSGRLAENGITVVADAGDGTGARHVRGCWCGRKEFQLVVRGFTGSGMIRGWTRQSAVCPRWLTHTNSRTAAGAHVAHDLLSRLTRVCRQATVMTLPAQPSGAHGKPAGATANADLALLGAQRGRPVAGPRLCPARRATRLPAHGPCPGRKRSSRDGCGRQPGTGSDQLPTGQRR